MDQNLDRPLEGHVDHKMDPYVDTAWGGRCIQETAFLVESQSEGNCNVRAWSNFAHFSRYSMGGSHSYGLKKRVSFILLLIKGT